MLYIAQIVIHTNDHQGDVTFKIFKNRKKAVDYLSKEYELHLLKIKDCSKYNLKDYYESDKDSILYYSHVKWETTYEHLENRTFYDSFDIRLYDEDEIVE